MMLQLPTQHMMKLEYEKKLNHQFLGVIMVASRLITTQVIHSIMSLCCKQAQFHLSYQPYKIHQTN